MADAADVFEVIKEWPFNKKLALFAAIVFTIAGISTLVWWTQTIDYQVLFSNLSQEDAASATARLKEMKIPYKLEGNGNVIMVPAKDVYDLRLELASRGVPQGGGVGYEIFDETKFGMTEFLQKVNYRRALQGELSRTIKQLSEVSSARVHITIPEKTIFTERQEPAKASVVVTLKSGKSLAKRQVQGIVRLVASSVEGLSPDQVTVLNAAGELLSTPRDEGPDGSMLTSSQAEYARSIAREYEGRVQSMLDGMLGTGISIVRADVDVDFRRIERTEEKVDPDTVAVVSEQRSSENSSGSTSGGGIPGVLSNSPGSAPGGGGGGASSGQKQNESINYEVSKTTSRIIEPSGVIKRLSIAVTVNGVNKAGADGKATYTPRTDDDMKRYEELVKAAVGFNAERGDKVSVSNVAFTKEVPEEVPETTDYMKYAGTAMKYLLPMIAMIMAFLLIFRPIVQSIKASSQMAAARLPRSIGELEAEMAGRGALPPAEPQKTSREEITDIVKQNPDQAAAILKDWMTEEA